MLSSLSKLIFIHHPTSLSFSEIKGIIFRVHYKTYYSVGELDSKVQLVQTNSSSGVKKSNGKWLESEFMIPPPPIFPCCEAHQNAVQSLIILITVMS